MALTVICLAILFLVILMSGTLIWILFSDYRRAVNRMAAQSQITVDKFLQATAEATSASRDEISQLAQSALSATTEATTQLSEAQLRWTETMVLGRDTGAQGTIQQQPNAEQIETEPTPGLENFEGLPDNIRIALEREMVEDQRQAELQRLSDRPAMPFDDRLNSTPLIRPVPPDSYQRPYQTNGTGDQSDPLADLVPPGWRQE